MRKNIHSHSTKHTQYSQSKHIKHTLNEFLKVNREILLTFCVGCDGNFQISTCYASVSEVSVNIPVYENYFFFK